MNEVQRHLQANALHVGLGVGRGHVHVHVQYATQGGGVCLLALQSSEKAEKPFELKLVSVDPDEVYLTVVSDT